jgi:hypothetical protein
MPRARQQRQRNQTRRTDTAAHRCKLDRDLIADHLSESSSHDVRVITEQHRSASPPDKAEPISSAADGWTQEQLNYEIRQTEVVGSFTDRGVLVVVVVGAVLAGQRRQRAATYDSTFRQEAAGSPPPGQRLRTVLAAVAAAGTAPPAPR